MIDLPNNYHIVQDVSELPNLSNRAEIFLDIESKNVSRLKNIGGMYPWFGDKICGISVTADDLKEVWYVPIRHTVPMSINEKCPEGIHIPENLPVANVMAWASDIITSCRDWINHNVKFDAMFFAVGDDVMFNCRLIDTLTLSKLFYSERFNFKLKKLCADWLGYDTSNEDNLKIFLDSLASKKFEQSYSDAPIEMLGAYACDDVRMNRQLYRYLMEHFVDRDLQCGEKYQGLEPSLIEMEIKLTSVLFDMEYEGMRIDKTQCTIESYKALKLMVEGSERLEKLTGKPFTNSNTNLRYILLEKLGLPVLSTIREKEDGRYVDTGRPSFDKDAMKLYQNHPSVTCDPNIKEIIDLVSAYRVEAQFKSLFLDTFLNLNVDGVLHPSYNQSVRTGRLSCSRPNSQQQNARSKLLILPFEGEGFCSNDYSQIEYRLTVHYCNIIAAIEAYRNDPKTDFHKWVADLFGIKRKPAKGLNFGQVYGMGKNGVVNALMVDPDIMKLMGAKVNAMVASGSVSPSLKQIKFEELCRTHGESAYAKYHNTMPEIRTTSDAARDRAKDRGFVFTAHGRRRYLPGNAARKAFNTIMQGCVWPDQFILTKEYGYAPIKNCVGPVNIWNGEKFVEGHVINSGLKKKVWTTFTDKTSIITSPDHKFYTVPTLGRCKWKVPSDFSKVERVAISTGSPVWATNEKLAAIPDTKLMQQPNGVWNTNDYSWDDIQCGYERGLMLGRLASDGSFSANQMRWLVAEHEKSILPTMEKIVQKAGWKYRIKKRDRTHEGRLPMYRLIVCSTKLKEQLRVIDIKNQIGAYLYSDSRLLAGFLKGFFDGDGGILWPVISLCFGKRHNLTSLPEDIQRALKIFGIQSRIGHYTYSVHLNIAKKCTEKFIQRIGFLNSIKQAKAKHIVGGKYHRNMPASVVDYVCSTDEEVEMFDVVNVPGHKFMCEGLILHNSSADIIKERMVFLSPRFNSESRAMGLKIRANVHDENLSGVPIDVLKDPSFHKHICEVMENTEKKFRVPIYTGLGLSTNNWAEAAGGKTILADGRTIDYNDLKDGDVPVAGKLK